MKQNTFKQGKHPQTKAVIPEHRQGDYTPRKLNPPVFEIDLKTDWRKGIAFSQAMSKPDFRRF